MSAEEKVSILTKALWQIAEATEAQYQDERGICPVCRRASTAKHLRDRWALIQSTAARAIRDTEEA